MSGFARASEPIMNLKSSEIAEVQTAPSTKKRGRKKRKSVSFQFTYLRFCQFLLALIKPPCYGNSRFSEMTPMNNSSPKSLEKKRNHWKMAE